MPTKIAPLIYEPSSTDGTQGVICGDAGIGIQGSLKHCCSLERVGSTPTHRTKSSIWECLRRQDRDLDNEAYAYLLGLYLGDGCISAGRREVFRLRIKLDSRYPGIINECAVAMSKVMPTNRIGVLRMKHENASEVSSCSKHWPCMFPQHGPGPKHLREIRLVPWQKAIVVAHPKALLRGLIHSDGCRDLNRVNGKSYPRYQFRQVSTDIRQIFVEACEEVGVKVRVSSYKAANYPAVDTVSIGRRDAVVFFDSFIGPKY